VSTELAWAAGFFDGDGNVSAYYRESRGTLTLQMVVTQKDRRPLQRLHTVLGVGRIYEVHPTARPERHWYQWQLHVNREVLRAMDKLWPYLSEPKREQWLSVKAKYDTYRAGLTFGRL
jgi:hypothetical protein